MKKLIFIFTLILLISCTKEEIMTVEDFKGSIFEASNTDGEHIWFFAVNDSLYIKTTRPNGKILEHTHGYIITKEYMIIDGIGNQYTLNEDGFMRNGIQFTKIN